jgi:hypothetical protein
MTISESFFGKKINDLAEQDLFNYFSTVRKESDNIEYKSYVDHSSEGGTQESRNKKKYSKILESITAFLNTGGGILIWGAPRGEKLTGETEESYSGNLTSVPYLIEHDSFFGKVSSEISPIPTEIFFKRISLVQGKNLYVFEVNRSEITPHQFKGTYFIRVGASTHTAPHQLVEAMIKRITFPKLEGYILFSQPFNVTGNLIVPIRIMLYNESPFINEKNVQFRILTVGCDVLNPFNPLFNYILQGGSDYFENAKPILHKNMPYLSELCLATSQQIVMQNDALLNVSLTFWGDSSPVVMSYYVYKVHISASGPNAFTLENIEQSENKLLMDKSQELIASGTKVSKSNVHREMAEKWHDRFTKTLLYKSLRGQ